MGKLMELPKPTELGPKEIMELGELSQLKTTCQTGYGSGTSLLYVRWPTLALRDNTKLASWIAQCPADLVTIEDIGRVPVHLDQLLFGPERMHPAWWPKLAKVYTPDGRAISGADYLCKAVSRWAKVASLGLQVFRLPDGREPLFQPTASYALACLGRYDSTRKSELSATAMYTRPVGRPRVKIDIAALAHHAERLGSVAKAARVMGLTKPTAQRALAGWQKENKG
jgi:hypothetical protein